MREGNPKMKKQLDDLEAAKVINQEIQAMMKNTPLIRWVFGQGMYTFKVKTPVEWLKMTRPYHLRDVASQITTTMLIIDSEDDQQMKGQAHQLYEALKSPKEWMLFKRSERAGPHCQIGAIFLSNERIFNWLDEQIRQQSTSR